ncbi:toxin glutamine deamidase domain-containing protein [Nocardia carnea]|uniref:toxin glutamine deamidase domain-containing protein n=1 Tax=Nocardia carnea TaxID=37328 RepID=UPI00031F4F66|nr:toxin glutamine deamidase domain-containing protein [Nocardia carnea]
MTLADPALLRVIGPDHLAPLEDESIQTAVEDALSGPDGFVRYADPSSFPTSDNPYGRLINPDPYGRPGRITNCADCVLAGLATFFGFPLAGVPVYPGVVDGEVAWGGEYAAARRQFAVTGLVEAEIGNAAGRVREVLTAVSDHVRHLGQSSAAIVSNGWAKIDRDTGERVPGSDGLPMADSEGHVILLVYPVPTKRNAAGELIDPGPLWWDPQAGTMSREPFEKFVDDSMRLAVTFIPPGRTIARMPAAGPPVPHPLPPPGPLPAVAPVRGRPAPLRLSDPAHTRRFGWNALSPVAHPGHQNLLERSLRHHTGGFVVGADPSSYPAPGYPYGRMINFGGSGMDERRINRWDALQSGLSSFLGNPLTAAERNPAAGAVDPEGLTRTLQWLQTPPDSFADVPVEQRPAALQAWVHHLGPGAVAVAFFGLGERDPDTGALRTDQAGLPAFSHYEPMLVIFPVVTTADGQTPPPIEPKWWDPLTNGTWDAAPDELAGLTVRFGFVMLRPGTTVDAAARGPAVALPPPPLVAPSSSRPGPPMRLPDPAGSRSARWLAPLEYTDSQVTLTSVLTGDDGKPVVGADPRSFPAPGLSYGWLVNLGGGSVFGRSTNKWDAMLSGLATFLGHPSVSLPRAVDIGGDSYSGSLDGDGRQRALNWLRTKPDRYRTGSTEQHYAALQAWIQMLGPGSGALVMRAVPETDPETGAPLRENGRFVVSHHEPMALLLYPAVTSRENPAPPPGPVWWDPVFDETWEQPPAEMTTALGNIDFIAIPPGRIVDPGIDAGYDSDILSSEESDEFDSDSADSEFGDADGADPGDSGSDIAGPQGRSQYLIGYGADRHTPADGRSERVVPLMEPSPVTPMTTVAWFTDEELAVIPHLYKDQDHAVWSGVGQRYQDELEASVSVGDRFAPFQDPVTFTMVPYGRPYGQLIAAEGRRGLRESCEDISLSLIATFFGRPQVAAERIGRNRNDLLTDGLHQAMRFLGNKNVSYHDGASTVAQQYRLANERITALGPGAAAFVELQWHKTANGRKLYHSDGSPQIDDGHVIVAMYPDYGPDPADDKGPVWYDGQTRMYSYNSPPADTVQHTAQVSFVFGTPRSVVAAAKHRQAVQDSLRDDRGRPARYRMPNHTLVPGGRPYQDLIDFRAGPPGRFSIIEAAVAGASCFLGNPAFVVPHRDSHSADGRPAPDRLLTGNGLEFVQLWFGRPLRSLAEGDRTIREQFAMAHDEVLALGSGSLGLVTVASDRQGAHRSLLLLSPRSENGADMPPVWWEPLTGEMYSMREAFSILAQQPGFETLGFVADTGRALRAHLKRPLPALTGTEAPATRRGRVRELPAGPDAQAPFESRIAELAATATGPETATDPEAGRYSEPGRPGDDSDSIIWPDEVEEYGADSDDPDAADTEGDQGAAQLIQLSRAGADRHSPPARIVPQIQPAAATPMNTVPWFTAAERALLPKLFKDQDRAVWGGVSQRHQDALEASVWVGDRFAPFQDPVTFTMVPGGKPYGQLISAEGRRGMGMACQDITLSLIATFYGMPQAAASQIGDITTDLLKMGRSQAGRFFGNRYTSFDDGVRSIERQYEKAHELIESRGPGAAMFVNLAWHKSEDGRKLYQADGLPQFDGGHALAVLYPDYGPDPADDKGPVWYDAQTKEFSYGGPPAAIPENTARVDFVLGTPASVVAAAKHRKALWQSLSDEQGRPVRYRAPSYTPVPGGRPYSELVDFAAGPRGRFGYLDAAIAGAASFLGMPTFTVPNRNAFNSGGRPARYRDLDRDDGEIARTWFGGETVSLARDGRTIAEQFTEAHEMVRKLGSGSLGLVVVSGGPRGAEHSALLLLYPRSDDGADMPLQWWNTTTGKKYSHRDALTHLVREPKFEALGIVAATGEQLLTHLRNPLYIPTATGDPAHGPGRVQELGVAGSPGIPHARALAPATGAEQGGAADVGPRGPGQVFELPDDDPREPDLVGTAAGRGGAEQPGAAPIAGDPGNDRPDAPGDTRPAAGEPQQPALRKRSVSDDEAAPRKRPRTDVTDPSAANPEPVSVRPQPTLALVWNRPEPPLRLADPAASRRFGPGQLAPIEHPVLQQILNAELRDRDGNTVAGADPRTFPVPGAGYGRLVNAAGFFPLGRRTNRWDATLAGLASFLGYPSAALPRSEVGLPPHNDHNEGTAGFQRAVRWLQTRPDSFAAGTLPEQYAALHELVRTRGPGTAVLVIHVIPEIDPATRQPVRDPGGGIRAAHEPMVIAYPRITARDNENPATGPVWWLPWSNETWTHPPFSPLLGSASFGFIVIPADRTVGAPISDAASGRPDHGLYRTHNYKAALRLPDPARSRPYGPGFLDQLEHPGMQKAVEQSLRDRNGHTVTGADPQTYPSPNDPYGLRVNGLQSGYAMRGRTENEWEAIRAGLASFKGYPTVAYPRHPGPDPDPARAVDTRWVSWLCAWLGSRPDTFRGPLPITQQYAALHLLVATNGPGTAAVALRAMPALDPSTNRPLVRDGKFVFSHYAPLLVVFPQFDTIDAPETPPAPKWWNPMTGEIWVQPTTALMAGSIALAFIPVDSRTTIDPALERPTNAPAPPDATEHADVPGPETPVNSEPPDVDEDIYGVSDRGGEAPAVGDDVTGAVDPATGAVPAAAPQVDSAGRLGVPSEAGWQAGESGDTAGTPLRIRERLRHLLGAARSRMSTRARAGAGGVLPRLTEQELALVPDPAERRDGNGYEPVDPADQAALEAAVRDPRTGRFLQFQNLAEFSATGGKPAGELIKRPGHPGARAPGELCGSDAFVDCDVLRRTPDRGGADRPAAARLLHIQRYAGVSTARQSFRLLR